MKTHTFLFITIALLSFYIPESAQADLKQSLKNSVVRISASYQRPDYYYPWRWHRPGQKSGQGIIVGEKLVLTKASTVLGTRLIEMRLDNEPTPSTLSIAAIDIENDLALLTGDLPKAAVPVEVPKKSFYKISSKIRFFWKTSSGRFLEGSAVIDRAEAFTRSPSFQAQLRFACANATMAGGFGEPVFHEDKFIGLATYGGATDLFIIPNELIHRSLDIANGKAHPPTAVAGFSAEPCTQPYLRESIGLKEDDGGCFINSVFDQGSGSKSLKVGDVLLELGGRKIDAWGRYEHETYGVLSHAQLFSDVRLTDKLKATIIRDKKKMEIDLDLSRIDDSELITPYYRQGEQSNYYINGGFVFQNLSIPYLKAWGKDWQKSAPEDILTIVNKYKFSSKSDKLNDIVLFSHVLSHPSNRGLQNMGRRIVSKVNGEELKGLRHLKQIFKDAKDKPVQLLLHPGDIPLLVSPEVLKDANKDIMLRYGLPNLENL